MANCRKIKRNMAKYQLKKEKARKINKIFSSEWKEAYVRNLVHFFRKNGRNIEIKEKVNG